MKIDYNTLQKAKETEIKKQATFIENFKGYNIYKIYDEYNNFYIVAYKNNLYIKEESSTTATKHLYNKKTYDIIRDLTAEEMEENQLQKLKNGLFTEEELTQDIKNFTEYQQKEYFLRNYYPNQYESATMFYISSDTEQCKERAENEKKYPYSSFICYKIFKDREPVKKIKILFDKLQEKKEKFRTSRENRYTIIKYELYNYECFYIYDWRPAYEELKKDGITAEEVQEVFKKEYKNYIKANNE